LKRLLDGIRSTNLFFGERLFGQSPDRHECSFARDYFFDMLLPTELIYPATMPAPPALPHPL
jgi:hypothetical protein